MDNIRYKWFKRKYKNLNRGNVKPFHFDNVIKYCKVVDIIDGQTVVIIMDFKNTPYKRHLRLDGYKTYVIRDIDKVNKKHKNIISNSAYKSIGFLSFLVNKEPNNIFKVRLKGYSPKGLLLGELYYPNNPCSLNNLMIKNGYGVTHNFTLSYLND